MKGVLVAAIVASLGWNTLRAEGEKISEDAVLRIIAEIQDAEVNKNAPALLSHLADDFTLTAKHPDGSVRAKMTFPEYKAFIEELFTKAADYRHSHSKIAVEIAPDGRRATARYETFQHEERAEKGKLDWKNLETDTFVLKDGKVLLRSVETVLQSRRQSPLSRARRPDQDGKAEG